MPREKAKRTGHGLKGADAAGKVTAAVAARKRSAPSAAGTVPAGEVAVARSRAPPAAGTAPAAVAADPPRSSSRRRRRSFCRPSRRRWCRHYGRAEHCRRRRRRRLLLDRTSGATAADSQARRGWYAWGEVAQVRGGWGWDRIS